MPKFGSHVIFAELAKQRRPDLFVDTYDNALRLGAIGPDTTLFMLDPATSDSTLREGVTTALSVLETIQDIKEQLREIEETVTQPIGDLADWLSGGLYYDMRYTVNAGISALKLAFKLSVAVGSGSVNVANPLFSKLPELPADFLKDPADAMAQWTISAGDNFGFPFRMFGHPFTDDGAWKQPETPGDYQKWWWMDLLHYRKTGQFASALLRNAAGRAERSYALGYMTHVGGDVCGHPFINALVGGPFRNHAYRHLVLETLADTWLWDHQGRGDILGARLDSLIDLGRVDEERIASFVVRTMREIYLPPMVPKLLRNGYPTADEWLGAMKLMKQYLRLSTDSTVPRPTPPPSGLEDVWNEMKDLLGSNVPGHFPRSDGKPEDFLRALIAWFGKGAVLLAMLTTLPVALVTRIVTVAPRWMLYLINLGMYYIVSALRALICMVGWGYCSIDDFRVFGFLEGMVTTPSRPRIYPYKTLPHPKAPFYWLASVGSYPSAQSEEVLTKAMSPPYGLLKPDCMVDPNFRMDVERINQLIEAGTPAVTRSIEVGADGAEAIFGNAVDFSTALLDGTIRVADFDLDGDRGFGYKGWQVLPPNEEYL
jgi:hypothetical protein